MYRWYVERVWKLLRWVHLRLPHSHDGCPHCDCIAAIDALEALIRAERNARMG